MTVSATPSPIHVRGRRIPVTHPTFIRGVARVKVLLAVLAPLLMGASPAVSTAKGLVVSADLAASEAGASVLRAGGNALDAAVATAFALAVVEPYSAGIGGGGFLIYRDAKTRKVSVIDYREVAPRKASRDMYIAGGKPDPKLSVAGILSVAVPGVVPGLAEAQRKLGKKTLAEVLDPAIELAEKGCKVTRSFHEDSVEHLELLRGNAAAAAAFLRNGEPYETGEILVQPDLAKTLRALKKQGPKLFTHGAVAKAIALESKRLGGLLTLEDLQRFKPRWRDALIGTYEGHQIITMPPPSSGGVHLLQILAMHEIDRQKRKPASRDLSTPDNVHYLAEAMRRAYADRAQYLGDPAFVDVPIKGLLSPHYLEARYRTIDPKLATPSALVQAGEIVSTRAESPDTTHLTVVDAAGNAAVLTQTINYSFGAGVVVPGTGVLLNNEMDDFSIAPGIPNVYGLVGGEANSIQPGKIPLSSMTPTLVLKNGAVRLALGSPGGSTIITTVLQIILRVIDMGEDVGRAVAARRLHHQWQPDQLRAEVGAVPPATIDALTARGHNVSLRDEPWGNATAIEIKPDGTRVGAADPRHDGAAVAE